MPDVRVDKVTKIGSVDAFDIFHEDCCKIMIVFTCFLSRNDNNCPSLITDARNIQELLFMHLTGKKRTANVIFSHYLFGDDLLMSNG